MIEGLIQLDQIAELLETTQEDAYRYFRGKVKSEWKDILIAYNIDNLELGIRPDESQIEKTPAGKQQNTRYERYTVYLKSKRGDLQVTEDSPVTLNETGNMRYKMFVDVGLNSIYISSSDPVVEQLIPIWGQFFGVTREQLVEFIEMVRDDMQMWAIRRFKRLNR
jgi:hypothetical protein